GGVSNWQEHRAFLTEMCSMRASGRRRIWILEAKSPHRSAQFATRQLRVGHLPAARRQQKGAACYSSGNTALFVIKGTKPSLTFSRLATRQTLEAKPPGIST